MRFNNQFFQMDNKRLVYFENYIGALCYIFLDNHHKKWLIYRSEYYEVSCK